MISEELQEELDCMYPSVGDPIPLTRTAVSNGYWLYVRKYGVFPVMMGQHELLMSVLYAFEVDEEEQDRHDYSDHAEQFMKTVPGVCYVSGAFIYGEAPVRTWNRYSLNRSEKIFFRRLGFKIRYLEGI